MSENVNGQSATLTGAKQTMASWSRVIESYEEVPSVYRSFFETPTADNQPFPYSVLTPSLVKPNGKTTEKLVCDRNDAIHILERNGSQVITTSYSYQTVRSVEVGTILLNSWLTISGPTSAGDASLSTIDFNTSSTRHFTTFLTKLRPLPEGIDDAKLRVEKDKFNYLSALNFKLMNYGRVSLVYGETVIQNLLQPEIKEPLWPMLGSMFLRTVSSAHLTILTNRELILIQDVGHGKKVQGSQYGGIWQYIPLRSIQSATWAETENGRLTLSITTSSDKVIQKTFTVPNQPELEQLCAQLKQ